MGNNLSNTESDVMSYNQQDGGFNNNNLQEVDIDMTESEYNNFNNLKHEMKGGNYLQEVDIDMTESDYNNNNFMNNINSNYDAILNYESINLDGGNNSISDTEYFKRLFTAYNNKIGGNDNLETVDLSISENQFNNIRNNNNNIQYSATSPFINQTEQQYSATSPFINQTEQQYSATSPFISNNQLNGGSKLDDDNNFSTNEFIDYLIQTGTKLHGGKDKKTDSDTDDSDDSDSDDEDESLDDSSSDEKDDSDEKPKKETSKKEKTGGDSESINSMSSDTLSTSSYNRKIKKNTLDSETINTSTVNTETVDNHTDTPYNLTSSINTSDINLVSFSKKK